MFTATLCVVHFGGYTIRDMDDYGEEGYWSACGKISLSALDYTRQIEQVTCMGCLTKLKSDYLARLREVRKQLKRMEEFC